MHLRLLASILLGALPAVSNAGDNPPIVVNDTRDLSLLPGPLCDADPLVPGQQCTLRAAVQLANGRAGPDLIVLTIGATYPLTLSGAGDAGVGDLNVTDDLVITGILFGMPVDTLTLPIIDAEGLGDRIFDIAAGVEAQLQGLRLRRANPGAIRNDGDLLVERTSITGNGGGANAPGIHLVSAAAQLQVVESSFRDNHSTSTIAAIHVGAGSAVIRRSSIRDNTGGASNAAIDVSFNGQLDIENSIIAGTEDAEIGVRAINPGRVTIRNSTLVDFESNALRITNLVPGRPVDVANSILAHGNFACEILLGGASADVRIGNSLIQSESGCASYYDDVVEDQLPTLTNWQREPGQVHWYRPPNRSLVAQKNNLIDLGIASDQTPATPAQACTSVDQRGVVRPQDGDLDGAARCDIGAVEIDRPDSMVWAVNYADEDLFDANIGNGICETAPGNGLCTLRAAIAESNARLGPDGIVFATAPGQTIELTLPTGGDLDISDDLVIHGAATNGRPQTTIRQQMAGERVIEVTAGDVLLKHLRLTGGDSSSMSGGAVRIAEEGDVKLDTVELFGNRSDVAGGAVSVIDGIVRLVDSDLHGNQAPNEGAALYVGGLVGTAIVERTSIWGNITDDSDGWAVFVAALSSLNVEASTIANNTGGGIRGDDAFVSARASTIAGNSGVGISATMSEDYHTFDLHSSIVAGNASQDCFVFNMSGAGTINRSYNLIEDGSCLTGSPTSFAADPLLSPPSRTDGRLSRFMRPQYVPNGPSSPALDVAPSSSSCGELDQRGLSRPVGLSDIPDVDGACDLGAVEVRLPLDGDSIFDNGFEQGPQLN